MSMPGRIWRWVLPNAGGWVEYADHSVTSENATPYTLTALHPTADELREARDNLASMILALDAKGEHHSGHYVAMLDTWANRLDFSPQVPK